MSAGTLKTLAVLAVFLTVDLCWMRGTTQQGKYTDRLVPMNACPHNVSAVQIKEPIWKKRATAREKKVQPEKPYAMLNCMNDDHFGNEDYDQSPRTTIRPQASHQPRKGAITRPFKGQPTPSMTCKTEMPSIHETEMIIIHKTNKGLSPEQISLPPPTFPPRRMSSQQATTMAADDPDAPMDPPGLDPVPRPDRNVRQHTENMTPAPPPQDVAGPSGTTQAPMEIDGQQADQPPPTQQPTDTPTELPHPADAGPQTGAAPPPYTLPKLTQKYVECDSSQEMFRAVAAQLQVLKDRSKDSKADTRRMEIAAKFIKAAAKWEGTPPIGVDYPGSRHAELAFSFISVLQHPLVTGCSISYSRLKYPAPKSIAYQNIHPHKTEKILERLRGLAAKCGKMPATITATANKDRVNITVECADSEKLSEIMAELASNSSQYGLHTAQESVMGLDGHRRLRPATWSPSFPMEANALTVSNAEKYGRCNANDLTPDKRLICSPPTPTCRETPQSGSTTWLLVTAWSCSQWPAQKLAPRNSTRSGLQRQYPGRSWLSLRGRCPRSPASSLVLTPDCGGRTPPESLHWLIGRRCCTSSAPSSTRCGIRSIRDPLTPNTKHRKHAPTVQPPPRQVLQINHLAVAAPRYSKYTACMESGDMIRALPGIGPIVMHVPDRFSMVAVSDQEGEISHFRHAVDFYVGDESDPNLIRTAARKAIERALSLKRVELLVNGLDTPDPGLELLTGQLGIASVLIKHSEVETAALDSLIILDSGLTLQEHTRLDLPNPTLRITLRGDSKVDAYPLLLAGANDQNHIYNGNLPMWSSMHFCSVTGAISKKELKDKRRWLGVHLMALSVGMKARDMAMLDFTAEAVEQAKLNLLGGDDWAEMSEPNAAPLPKDQVVRNSFDIYYPARYIPLPYTPPHHTHLTHSGHRPRAAPREQLQASPPRERASSREAEAQDRGQLAEAHTGRVRPAAPPPTQRTSTRPVPPMQPQPQQPHAGRGTPAPARGRGGKRQRPASLQSVASDSGGAGPSAQTDKLYTAQDGKTP